MPLCNQGCKTKVYFRDGRPYNVADDEPHEKTCMSLKMGKWWGGYFDTIPMKQIRSFIQNAYDLAVKADESKNVYDMIDCAKEARTYLASVINNMQTQASRNEKWAQEFAEYKTNLVQQQALREERKRTRTQHQQQSKGHEWTTAKDDLLSTGDLGDNDEL